MNGIRVMTKYKKTNSSFNYLYLLGIVGLLMQSSWAETNSYTPEYLKGYIHAIIDELLPEEEVTYGINSKMATITILNKSLSFQEEEKLKERINKTNLFSNVIVTYQNYSPSTATTADATVSRPATAVDELLPNGVIYDAPIADQKWPKFLVGYQKHFRNNYGTDIFKLSFGENLALFRSKSQYWTYEVGIQAGLFGIMDFSSKPSRLINSDYFVGLGFSLMYNDKWQNLFQLSHQSSHLGDEFLISKPAYLNKRINLSYETLKWYTAYKFEMFRPYLGIGYLIDKDPSYLKSLTCEIGLDYISKTKFFWDKTNFVFGIHSFFWQENRFNPTINVSTGLQLDTPVWKGRSIRLLLDYGHGPSQQGQLYVKKENYVGLSISISS